MIDWLARALGVEIPAGTKPGELRFEWGSLPQGQEAFLLALVALGLLALVVWLYRREGAASPARKAMLATLRILALVSAFLVLLEPRLARDTIQTRDATTIVLWDESLSMSLPDRYHDPALRDAVAAASGIAKEKLANATRAEVAHAIVERASLLPGLAAKNKLKLYAFGEDVRPIATIDAKEIAPKSPATDLARAVRRALEEHGGLKIAAVVAVTDGRSNKGESLATIAQMLRERGTSERDAVPFYAIGIGDPQAPKNIEVAELAANERAYKNDPIVLEGRVRARGFAGEKVDAELWVAPRDDPTHGEKVDSKQVTLPADGAVERVSFTYIPRKTGEFVFTLKIPPRDEEPVVEDNQRSAVVSVIDDETKVLLVAGGPTDEFRSVRNLLLREKTVKLTLLLESASADFASDGKSTLIRSIPRSKEELFAFDVILLMDPSPRVFDQDVVDLLGRFVGDHGGGLLYVAGEKYSGPLFRSADLKALIDLLPVIPDVDRAVEYTNASKQWTEPLRIRATDEAEDHPVTRLDADVSRSRAIWQHLPPVHWLFPVQKEKAGAVVLVRSDDPRAESVRGAPPLVAAHFYGPGRTLYMGIDETWRWRAIARRAYERFWVQALRFLVEGRLLGGRKRLELTTDKDEYSLGEPVRIRVKALDRSYMPLDAPAIEAVARVEGGDAVHVNLIPSKERRGTFEASFIPQARGVVELTAKLPEAALEEKPARKSIRVRLPDLEFQDPCLDDKGLKKLAEETKGELVAPQDVAKLAAKIPPRSERLALPAEPLPLWDKKPTIALIVLLLSIEWFVRKRSKMV